MEFQVEKRNKQKCECGVVLGQKESKSLTVMLHVGTEISLQGEPERLLQETLNAGLKCLVTSHRGMRMSLNCVHREGIQREQHNDNETLNPSSSIWLSGNTEAEAGRRQEGGEEATIGVWA